MCKTTPENAPKPPAVSDARAARLKASLKANIAKRKAQARARDRHSGADVDKDEAED